MVGCLANYSSPSTAEVKNEWIYASNLPRLHGVQRNNFVLLLHKIVIKRLYNFTDLKYNKISIIEIIVMICNRILSRGFVTCDGVLFGIFSS